MPKKILLADDSITIQKVVELTFSDADYEVIAVNNGAKAIAKLAEMRPDIILSDIIMPEKNGYEVCEFVKSHPEYRNIPVVLLTGTFEPFDPDRAEKAGCDAVVTKPFESQSLIQKVEDLISQAEVSAPAPQAEPQPAPSAWNADTEVVPLPAAPPSPFTTSSGKFPTPEAFQHDAEVFNAAPSSSGTTEMPFDTPAAEEFSGETRAFPKMTFDEMAQMESQSAPSPAPEPAPEPEAFSAPPEPSPWDEQPEQAFGGETRAFPKMTFDEMMMQQGGSPEAMPEPELPTEAENESPFGAPPAPEEFSGDTRAIPKLTLENIHQMSPPPLPEPAPAPEPESLAAPEPSPWDEQPALGGETRAFPKMTFDEMLAAEPVAQPEPSPWEEPQQPVEEPQAEPEPEALPWDTAPPSEPEWAQPAEEETQTAFAQDALGEAESFAAEPAPAEPSYIEEVPPPVAEPEWAQPAEADAQAEVEEPPVPSPVFAPQTPSLPIAARDLTDEQIDRIARRVVELMSDQVVRNIAWEVIPDLAEMVVKERIRQLESEA